MTAQDNPASAAIGISFWYQAGKNLGRPAANQLLNREGSPRITDPAQYDRFRERNAARLRTWAQDHRLNLNPNFVAALIAKESGFDPRATSHVPANGLAQITHIADADLRIIAEKAPVFQWMQAEVSAWPRHPAVHSGNATKRLTDSLLAAGQLHGKNEYLFDEERSLRAAMFWLRVLAEVWLEDEWPGMYGRYARDRLNGGRPLSELQLLELVTVSYNQGHPYVHGLIKRHGKTWTRQLNAEASDYLERIRHYTAVFQNAPAN